ncbi:glycosyltransferase family A protein [Butyrivibrio fibrisolvens]|uniref:glycosyltransferase family A protein n=1 Tax=Butyrivibrio fibrisolvens TaxID=831 RepID=UPI000405002B|nr:glycosyltransferase family A protein [Butyrivibrio fibrisolvens]
MIDKLYTDVQNMKSRGSRLWPYVYKVNKLMINILYPLKARCDRTIGIDGDSNVVVSLTTYPDRIKTVWVTIASLLDQTYKPCKVILWLSGQQFPDGYEKLPDSLKRLTKRGLEIRFVDGDLKPHKKYYYALKEFIRNEKGEDYLVITADDDIFYPETHIKRYAEASKKYPEAVICSWSHKIAFEDVNGEKTYTRYNTWEDNSTPEPDMKTIPVGCNGVLYKAAFFDDELFNTDNICKYSIYTDDLWLKVMEVRNGIKVYNLSNEPLIYYNNIFTMKSGLWHTNTGSDDNRNDNVWRELNEEYPDVKRTLIDYHILL